MATDGSRRRFLTGIGGLAAGFLGGCLEVLDGGSERRMPDRTPLRNASVGIDPGAGASEWAVDERIFGKFIEHNGRDVYPGVYSDHLVNGSFEIYNTSGRRPGLLFDVGIHLGIARGWEPIEDRGRVSFDQVPGGVHGRRPEPELDSGVEVPLVYRPWPRNVTESRFQRVEVGGRAGIVGRDGASGRGGVSQRTALPDRRTTTYEVEITVRGEGISNCEVELAEPAGSGAGEGAGGGAGKGGGAGAGPQVDTTLAGAEIPVTDEWKRHNVTLELDARSDERYRGTPFGTYALAFIADGEGRLDLDWAVLRAGDAVEGMFNPTTIERLREFEVTSIRWPGGNFANQYRWRDGVGPLEERPVVPNCNWGGLERNSLGTNEFLRFCKLAEVEPLITVASWKHVPPEEAAAWVEYVNGSVETEMGAMRAEHGFPEPWGVTAWQVGNENWGSYQVGHVTADRFADRYEASHEAMKAADPSIEIDAAGIDPYYTEFSDGSVFDREIGQPPTWNEIVFERANATVEGIDVHRYVEGTQFDVSRRLWRYFNDADPVDYNEVLVNFPSQYEELLAELREQAADRDIEDLRINVGEWNLQPKVGDGWPRADYPTTAHAAFVASMFNTFIRKGDAVRLTYMRDNTLYHRPYPHDCRPINPGNYVHRLYAEPIVGEKEWHHLPVEVDAPTLTIPKTGFRIREQPDVPYLDVAAVQSSGGDAIVFAVNRNVREEFEVEFEVESGLSEVPVTLLHGAGADPFARRTNWEEVNGFELTENVVSPEGGSVALEMPPASVAKLELEMGDGSRDR